VTTATAPELGTDSEAEILDLYRAHLSKGRATLAELLLNLGDRVEGKPERPMPDLPSALAELEKAIATQIKHVSDTGVAAQIRARLTLYQEAVPFAIKLTKL